MKHCLKAIFALAATITLAATSIQAQSEEKVVIAVKTDGFELAEMDISSLAVGEGKTIETKSGKVIDILRTPDGAEIYVDGELLDVNVNDESLHEKLVIRKHVEVICDEADECDEHVVIHAESDGENSEFITDDGNEVQIHKEIEISCAHDDEDTTCSDKIVWISGGEGIDLEELHKTHAKEEIYKIIVINKETDSEG
jgi:hypothetical protein